MVSKNKMHIGKLSAKYESNGDPGAIGYDPGGGWSYGINQIETRNGTFKFFMEYIKDAYPAIHSALDAAGGFQAARSGTASFKSTWKQLAKSPEFKAVQHAYIVNKFYHVAVNRIKTAGIDLSSPPRSNALADVIYSLTVMAGVGSFTANGSGSCGLIFDALTAINGHQTVNIISDEDLIKAIYAQKIVRIDTKREYRIQPPNIVQSVRNRMLRELQDALKMLARE